ncbi:hypothetical protein [Arthrobacter sp. A2-55]|uniref:hypothetical protein n=1 Tax=Arthrobacter sp. A2-55 TaxID=2897337 RepID=UPI0021CD2FF4|nr:hypothetical protein [Arthrobacter sp. A2-55]MCU6480173.1 hypothetical protein [Arthrobacter sp. A2-55]
MTMFNEADHPRATTGKFSTKAQSESTIQLAAKAPDDARRQLNAILTIWEGRYEMELSTRCREIRKVIKEGGDPVAELEKLAKENVGGRCHTHAGEPAQSSPDSWCKQCQCAFVIDGTLNPRPTPTVYGIPPRQPKTHHLARKQLVQVDDPENEHVTTTTTDLSGDKVFADAVRKAFKAPARTKVTVTEEMWEDFTNYTVESGTEITVQCGKTTATYSDLGMLMRALDAAERPSTLDMARRFMRAADAPRPLLYGIAAVYMRGAGYSAPKPVFGKIHNVFSQGLNPSFEFMSTDGQRSYIEFSRVAAILETSDSGEYDENL